jgi:hypothetical protein
MEELETLQVHPNTRPCLMLNDSGRITVSSYEKVFFDGITGIHILLV